MKNYEFVAGIDVSKATLDVCILKGNDAANCCFCQVPNNLKGYLRLLSWLKKMRINPEGGLFLLEHTGIYSLIVSLFLKKQEFTYSLIPGLVLKNSLGICRGKTDKKDAYAIARFGYLYRNEINFQPVKDELVLRLQAIFSQRKRLVTALKTLQAPVDEMVDMGLDNFAATARQIQQKAVDELKLAIKESERQMLELLEEDPDTNKQFQLCTSIPGVGLQLASYLIIVTHSFTRFSNSRKLATYAGVAPFPYQSGTSIKGKNKVSPIGDKTLKELLHMSSLNAIRLDNQLKQYYQRKKDEGKNAMLVLNAVRNKLLARITATVDRGTPYVQLAQYAS